ncbi:MAG TPA: 3-phosphoshikimate 1-carboxyvinyltransferase, partial [Oceanithermus sp.]|nr:3-phosphoshikimate 1-carboxyvinyltransferase [Oceanithermus sp.]
MRSPWAKLQDALRVELYPPPGPVVAELRVPGSKSATNRALLLAGFARGPSVLRGILKSDDAYWAVEALKALGI